MKPILVPLMLAGAFVGNGWLERSGDTPIRPQPEPVVEDHITHEEHRPDRRPGRSSSDGQQEARRRAAAALLIMAMAQQNQQDRYQARRQQQLQERLRYEAALQQRWNRMQGNSGRQSTAGGYSDVRAWEAQHDQRLEQREREWNQFLAAQDRQRRNQENYTDWVGRQSRQEQSYPTTADEGWVTANPNLSGGYTYTGRDGSVTHSFGNLSGGETFTDGSYTRPNIHGGIDVVQADGSVVTGMPNLSGGQTFTNGLSMSHNVFGGIDFMFGGRTLKRVMPTLGGGWQSQ